MLKAVAIPHSRLAEFLESSEVITQKINHPLEYRKSFDSKMGRLTFHLIPVTMDSAVLMLKRGQASIILQDKGGQSFLFIRSPECGCPV